MFGINSKLKKNKKCFIQNCSTTNNKFFIAFFGSPIPRRKLSSLAIKLLALGHEVLTDLAVFYFFLQNMVNSKRLYIYEPRTLKTLKALDFSSNYKEIITKKSSET